MPTARLQDCADDAVALVRRWLEASRGVKPEPGAARLAAALRDPRGLDFTRGFVDKVIRPEDPKVAARNLEKASRDVPDFLAWYLRGAVTLGGGFATMAPWAVIPSARKVLRRMTGHLVVDATPARLGSALARTGGPGTRLDVDLLGPAVLGAAGSDRRLRQLEELAARDDVPAVSVALAAVLPPASPWAFDVAVEQAVERLTPLFRVAAESSTTITLQTGEHRDLDLTTAVFRALLDREEFAGMTAGITLPASLPDSAGALEDITAWAIERRTRGGSPVRVRLVKGAYLAVERVDALLHDRPLATFGSKRQTDAAYLRLLDTALTPERTDAVRIGAGGHDLFDVATAWVLAERRGVTDAVEIEMLLGMTATTADAVRATVGEIVLSTPVVHPDAFDAAIPYLARRLQDSAGQDSAAASALDLVGDEQVFERRRDRYTAAVAATEQPVPATNRTQDRTAPLGEPVIHDLLANTADTDPSVAVNRAWAADVLRRVPRSSVGLPTLRSARVASRQQLERTIARTAQAGVNWGRQEPEDRAELLDLVAHGLESRRADLVEAMVSETGITLSEADVEVSGAVDAARRYADRARHLVDVTGARSVPPRLTVVVSSWNAPVASPAGGVLAALAAGSGVVLKPAPQAGRCGALLADVFWDAGVPRSLFALVDLDEGEFGRELVAHPAVDRVLLTGSPDTARSFRWWRAGLRLTADTGGTNSIAVTPSADLDQAVRAVVASAFARAGQGNDSVSLLVLVGSVAESERFREQLVDATRSLRAAWPYDPAAQVGPLVAAPAGVLRSALTALEPGESWLVEPEALDDSGRLWSPGIRIGVRPGSDHHRTGHPVPVLNVVQVETLEDAIAVQNATDGALVAGLHSLDVDEVARWSDAVRAGNLFVNRPTTGAVVGRQPFGGWGSSAVGTGTKTGGPLYVATLGRWDPVPRQVHRSIQLDGLSSRVTAVIEAARSGLSFEEFDQVRAGAMSDVQALATEFGRSRDTADLVVERNVLRYRPQSVVVRQSEDASTGDLVRVLVAATAARAHVLLSTARALPGPLTQMLAGARAPLDVVDHLVESDAEFTDRVASGAVFQENWSNPSDPGLDAIDLVLSQGYERRPHTAFGGPGSRIRLLGGHGIAIEEALGAGIDTAIHDGPVVEAGLIEMLPFLREQTVTITAHRHGDVDPEFAALRV